MLRFTQLFYHVVNQYLFHVIFTHDSFQAIFQIWFSHISSYFPYSMWAHLFHDVPSSHVQFQGITWWNAPWNVYPHVVYILVTWSHMKCMYFFPKFFYMQIFQTIHIFYKQYFSTLTFNCKRNLKSTVCFSPFHTPAYLKRWVIWQRRCLVYWELASVSTDCYLCGGSPLWLH